MKEELLNFLAENEVKTSKEDSILINTVSKFYTEKLKTLQKQIPEVTFSINAISSENWVAGMVRFTIFSKILKGDLTKFLGEKEVSILSLYVMLGLGTNTANTRGQVRKRLQIDEKQLNSINKILRDKGILIADKIKPSNYTLCEDLEIIRRLYSYCKNTGKESVTLAVKLLNNK